MRLKGITDLWFSYQTHLLNFITRKHWTNHNRGTSQNAQTVLLETIKAMKNKERLRNTHDWRRLKRHDDAVQYVILNHLLAQ